VFVDADGHAVMNSIAAGQITLDLPDLAGQVLLALSDGSLGSIVERFPTVSLLHDTGAVADDRVTSDPTLTGRTAPGQPVTVYVDGTASFTVHADAQGQWTAAPAVGEGSHFALVSVTDPYGNVITNGANFNVVTTPPVVTISQAGASVGGSAAPGGLVTVDDGTAILGSATADAGGAWSLPLSLSTGTYTLTASEPDSAGNFGVASVTFDTASCFLAGTRISTHRGEIAVEDLAIGDLILTPDGDARPIRWIGRRAYPAWALARNPALRPVRITRSALAASVPERDLLLSPSHALAFATAHGRVLINAGMLVNGITITQDEAARDIHYFHVELDDHDILFAEGAPAETFLDADCRGLFANAAEFAALYPGADGAAVACLERVEDGLAFAEVLARLEGRAGMMPAEPPGPMRGFIEIEADGRIEGWVQDLANPDLPVLIEVVAGTAVLGRAVANIHRADLAAAGIGKGRHAYRIVLPEGTSCGQVTLRRQEDRTVLPQAEARERALAA
jgi:hypothetical protein